MIFNHIKTNRYTVGGEKDKETTVFLSPSVNCITFLIAGIFMLLLRIPLAYALTPEEILIVYNSSMPESKSVAKHYAMKRGVPKTNLIPLFLLNSESISRKDYETKMLPIIIKRVKNRIDKGKKPTLLLVYGIPLMVLDAQEEPKNNDFEKYVQNKIQETGNLILELNQTVKRIIGSKNINQAFKKKNAPPPSRELTLSLQQTMRDAVNYMNDNRETRFEEHKKKSTLTSLLLRLSGSSSFLIKKPRDPKQSQELHISQDQPSLPGISVILIQQAYDLQFSGTLPENVNHSASLVQIAHGVLGELRFWESIKSAQFGKMTKASVDSELSLILREPFPKTKWLSNPFLQEFDAIPGIQYSRANTIMVARVDASASALAKRMIDDAIETEEKGLDGIFYIDARGLDGNKNQGSYGWYDDHLRNLYKILKEQSDMEVIINNKPELFQEKSFSNAALYVGWYSLGKYVDSFEWNKGSVGFHIASSEATTLKKAGSQVWCKRMIEEGVAATLGPVAEPYLLSFPLPDLFFPLLMSGDVSLVEAYYRTIPSLSWRQVLLGDPLYNPFKNKPAIISPE